MRLLSPSPIDALLWGWRCAAWGYVGIAALGVTLMVPVFGVGHPRFESIAPVWKRGTIEVWCRNAHLVSSGEAPHIDVETGLVVVSDLWLWSDDWNANVRAAVAVHGAAGLTFRDRVIDPARMAADFDRDPGIDVGDGAKPFTAGDRAVSIAVYKHSGHCSHGIPDRLVSGSGSFPVDRRFLRITDPTGQVVPPIGRRSATRLAWVPHMSAVRARVSDDGRTLWLRGTDVESQRWIITADLVTATVIQIDADPAE
jgi:hypothetical protein